MLKRKIANIKFDIKHIKPILCSLYMFNIFDLVATTIWVYFFGLGVEANPIARMLYETNAIYVVKIFGVALGLFVLGKYLPKNQKWMWLLLALFFIYAAIVVYHIFIALNLLIIFI